VTPVLGLFVVVRIEVEVMQDDSVRSSKVDPQASRLGRQNEDKNTAIVVELVDQTLPGNIQTR
jgi:hypothetical protein